MSTLILVYSINKLLNKIKRHEFYTGPVKNDLINSNKMSTGVYSRTFILAFLSERLVAGPLECGPSVEAKRVILNRNNIIYSVGHDLKYS